MGWVDDAGRAVQVRVVCVGPSAAEYVRCLATNLDPSGVRPTAKVTSRPIDLDDGTVSVTFLRPAPVSDTGYRMRLVVVARARSEMDDATRRLLEDLDLLVYVAVGDGSDGVRFLDVADCLRFELFYRDVPTLLLLDRATANLDASLDVVVSECGLFQAERAEIATDTGQGVTESLEVAARVLEELLQRPS